MLVDTETVGTELEIWEQPGLFVYTSIGEQCCMFAVEHANRLLATSFTHGILS